MELNVKLCGMQCHEDNPIDQYFIQEDNGDPIGCIHIIPNKDKGNITLDRLGIKDLIEVLTMFKNRM